MVLGVPFSCLGADYCRETACDEICSREIGSEHDAIRGKNGVVVGIRYLVVCKSGVWF